MGLIYPSVTMHVTHIYYKLCFLASAPQANSIADQIPAIIGIIGTVLSLILGGISIWLSLYFFRRATEAEQRAASTSQNISTSVDIIQKIHDKIYGDLLGMTKEAYADIRAKAFAPSPNQEIGQNRTTEVAAANIDEAKIEMQQYFDKLLSRLDDTDGQVKALASMTRPVIAAAVDRGRAAVETARASVVEIDILSIIGSGSIAAENLMKQGVTRHSPQEIIETLRTLYSRGTITWSSPTLEADTMVRKAAAV